MEPKEPDASTGYAAIKYTAIVLITGGLIAFGVWAVDTLLRCR